MVCKHYDDITYISKDSRQYFKDTCPLCVIKVEKKCNLFWGCCLVVMRLQKSLKCMTALGDFVSNCYHFKYERSNIDFCIEGNLFENSRPHVMRYFDNIDKAEDFTSQRFKTISLSDAQRRNSCMSYESSMLNTVCKTYSNGSRCVNCDMKNDDTKNSDYVGIRPKTNLDNFCKQVALHINVTPINHLGMR